MSYNKRDNVRGILALHVSPKAPMGTIDQISSHSSSQWWRPNSSGIHGHTCIPISRFARNSPITVNIIVTCDTNLCVCVVYIKVIEMEAAVERC